MNFQTSRCDVTGYASVKGTSLSTVGLSLFLTLTLYLVSDAKRLGVFVVSKKPIFFQW